MKKTIYGLLVLVLTIFMTGCAFGFKNTKDLKTKDTTDGYKTYAFKMNHWVKDGVAGETYKYVFKYDKDGNFKYYKYIYTMGASINDTEIDLDDAELLKKSTEGDCSKIKSYNYAGYQTICGLREGQVAMLGFIINDDTIAAGILNDVGSDNNTADEYEVLKQGLKEFDDVSTEEKAKVQFEKLKDNLKASNGDSLIIENQKIELSN